MDEFLENSVRGKCLVFKFKDTKIVKSKKKNEKLRMCTTIDVQREIKNSFDLEQDKLKKCTRKFHSLLPSVISTHCGDPASEAEDRVQVEVKPVFFASP